MEHEMSTAAKEKVLGKYKLLSPDFKPPPHPPPLRPSRLVKSLAGVDGGDFLIRRRRNDAGWRFIFPSLQSASGTYYVWQLLHVATIATSFEVLRRISASPPHIWPVVLARSARYPRSQHREQRLSFYFFANSLALVSL